MLFWWESKPGPLYPGRGGWWASAVQALLCCQGRGGGGGGGGQLERESEGEIYRYGEYQEPKGCYVYILCH